MLYSHVFWNTWWIARNSGPGSYKVSVNLDFRSEGQSVSVILESGVLRN